MEHLQDNFLDAFTKAFKANTSGPTTSKNIWPTLTGHIQNAWLPLPKPIRTAKKFIDSLNLKNETLTLWFLQNFKIYKKKKKKI